MWTQANLQVKIKITLNQPIKGTTYIERRRYYSNDPKPADYPSAINVSLNTLRDSEFPRCSLGGSVIPLP